jgi:hypothetical protein
LRLDVTFLLVPLTTGFNAPTEERFEESGVDKWFRKSHQESREQTTNIRCGFSLQIKPFAKGRAVVEIIDELVAASAVRQPDEQAWLINSWNRN